MHLLAAPLQHLPAPPVIVGLLLLLFGWVLYRAVLTVAGGILGAAAGYGLGLLASRLIPLGETASLIAVIGGAALGIITGVFLFRWLHRLAFFLSGMILGGWTFAEIFLSLRASQFLTAGDAVFALGIVIAALLGGILLVFFAKHLVVIASSAIGTLLLMSGLGWPYHGLPAIPLFLIGLAIQLRLARLISRRERKEE